MSDNDQMVPISRLNAKQSKIEALEAQVASLKTTAGAGTAAVQVLLDEALASNKALKGEAKATATAHAAELTAVKVAGAENAALTAAGITNEKHVRIARMLYADSDDDKKGDFADWLPKAAASDDVLSVLLGETQAADADTVADTDTTDTTAPPKSTNTGAGGTPAAGGALTMAAYNAQLDKHIAAGEKDKARDLQARWSNG